MRVASVLAGCVVAAWVSAQPPSAPQVSTADGIERLVAALQTAIQAGNPAAVRALADPQVDDASLAEFTGIMTSPPVTAVTVKERDRAVMPGGRQRVLLEILTERDREGVVSTWRLDVAPPPGAAVDATWRITQIEKLTILTGLYRLALDAATEYTVTNLVLQAPDLTLRLPAGRAFTANTGDGPTALVLLGHGTVEFAPRPESERGQVRIFCGADALTTRFESVFVRLNPSAYDMRIAPGAMTPRTLDRKDLRNATDVFESLVPRSFQIDVGDLSRQRWSLVPGGTDIIAEIATKKYGTLTYARAASEPEDISFFDRRRKKNIAVYASEAKLAERGRFFSDDDSSDYDVTHYDVHAAFSPDRLWLEGRTRMTFRTKSPNGGTMTLRLADPLVVRSVVSPRFGRLLHLRVTGQNSILVSFPTAIPPSSELVLDISYGGRLPPQPMDREAIAVAQDPLPQESVVIPLEPQYVYSNRSYWYPQAQTTDYATARLTIEVPSEYDVVASGAPDAAASGPLGSDRGQKAFVFDTTRPARYLACMISRFEGVQTAQLNLPLAEEGGVKRGPSASPRDGGGADTDVPPFQLIVQATPHQAGRTRDVSDKAADVLRFYTSILADVPYGSFTVAMAESDLPGGHSPAYFAIVNQPLPTSPYTWQNDPVAFRNYPSFFLAHEIAHQWWGQAVGWKNYHEQWLSEGFAQYFAALYAERERGPDEFTSIIRQMRKTAMDMSKNGPVYLGYRLGHLKGDSRVFRALVYNKGALVLHMLRRLIGDRAFFDGIREFYATWRYRKAGTDDFRVSMERASGLALDRFFERWIYADTLPELRFSSHVSDGVLHVAFEQKTTELFDVPVTVTVTYADGTSQDVVVPVTERRTDRAIPIKGQVRRVDVNRDGAALAEIRN